ncbi:MAG: ABC transporter substrate-binding protein [Thermodesulfobacteriota bacterium]
MFIAKNGEMIRINKVKSLKFFVFIITLSLLVISGCILNSPYRSSESGKNVFYTTFSEPPKHLDPAISYSSNEYVFIGQIYEPPLQYHYLKRPFELIPLTLEDVPSPQYFDKKGNRLPQNITPDKVHRTVYELRIKKGIMYQPHPAFARSKEGERLYHKLSENDVEDVKEIKHFQETGTRELIADDYIYQIKRLADPMLHSPILSILGKYILGLEEYAKNLNKEIEEIRKQRKEKAGAGYNQQLDERLNPIQLDMNKYPFPGAEKVDSHTFRIVLKTKYPQFLYWLAMPFFAPMPEEAIQFYKQGVLADKNITIDRFPVGTGAYRMETFNPNMEIALTKNENFHGETFPSEGEDADEEADKRGDEAMGLLDDAGKTLPFIEKIVFKLEKEAIPLWNKFLQGYYDSSGISSDSFDQAIKFDPQGSTGLTDFLKEKEIQLSTSVRPSTYYFGFNMLDDVIGGYSEENQKLRQAISIAINYEEYIEIFNNGRGIPAMSPLPSGIFGYLEGESGINPYVYDWDTDKKTPVRKPIEYAQQLMEEAGYLGGRDKNGKPLVITFDNSWTGVGSQPLINWYVKRLKLLGIQLENRTTDYNRFQDKMRKGNFQMFSWGWNADYPDPENFFFLLVGDNSKVKHLGENAANYENDEFDALFRVMENMDNSPKRLEITRRMIDILQKDAPWAWGFHPVAFGLRHGWVGNSKPNQMANNSMKYIKIDPIKREEKRREWNNPNLWPVAITIALLVIGSLPAVISVRRRNKGR